MSNSFKLAIDQKQPGPLRRSAALCIQKSERKRLQIALLQQIPGDWNKASLDAIVILGEIGDETAAKELERIDKMPYDESGKFHSTIIIALSNIHKRATLK